VTVDADHVVPADGERPGGGQAHRPEADDDDPHQTAARARSAAAATRSAARRPARRAPSMEAFSVPSAGRP